jgi:hypothetical protein
MNASSVRWWLIPRAGWLLMPAQIIPTPKQPTLSKLLPYCVFQVLCTPYPAAAMRRPRVALHGQRSKRTLCNPVIRWMCWRYVSATYTPHRSAQSGWYSKSSLCISCDLVSTSSGSSFMSITAVPRHWIFHKVSSSLLCHRWTIVQGLRAGDSTWELGSSLALPTSRTPRLPSEMNGNS